MNIITTHIAVTFCYNYHTTLKHGNFGIIDLKMYSNIYITTISAEFNYH